jgi:hypothetical protein
VTREGQPEAMSIRVRPRFRSPHEAIEQSVAIALGDAGARSRDLQQQPLGAVREHGSHRRVGGGELPRVVDQVLDRDLDEDLVPPHERLVREDALRRARVG